MVLASKTLASLARVTSTHSGGIPLQGRPGIPVCIYDNRRLFNTVRETYELMEEARQAALATLTTILTVQQG